MFPRSSFLIKKLRKAPRSAALYYPYSWLAGVEATLGPKAVQVFLCPGLRPPWNASWGAVGCFRERAAVWGREKERRAAKAILSETPGVCVKDKIVCPMGKYS